MDYGDFQHILDELNGLRAARRPNGKILMHYGDLTDPDDPRWQVIDRDVAESLLEDIDFVLNDERMKPAP